MRRCGASTAPRAEAPATEPFSVYIRTLSGPIPIRRAIKLSERIKPISYLKANAAEVIQKLGEHQQPFIITVNGEAKAVLQDIDSYEEMQEAIAFLKIVAMGREDVRAGRTLPLDEAFERIRKGEVD